MYENIKTRFFKVIYLDNAATTKPCRECVQAVSEAMELSFGNASSLHKMGTSSINIINRTKQAVLKVLALNGAALDGEILFTSGATESSNTALLGLNLRAGSKIVTTKIEHPSVAKVIDRLEERGFNAVRLAPKDCPDFVGAIINEVDENTSLVSCMAVNNETGFQNDVKRLYKAVKAKNPRTFVHIDAVQGFLKIPLDGDLISVSGHKIHSSKGIGALYIKKGVTLSPLLSGGGQQKNLRSGTEAVELIAGLEAAVKAYKYDYERFSALKQQLLGGLSGIKDVSVNSDDKCLPNIVNFSVRGVRSEIMLHSLEKHDICVSSGSACSKGKTSNVLSAFGVSDKDADCAIRVSMCAENTEQEIAFLCEKIAESAKRFRGK